jgi:hypothetical protein
MKHTQHFKPAYTLSLFVVLFALILSATQNAFAAPLPQQGTGGLLVNGAILDLQAQPGMVYVHKMQIGVGEGSPAMNVTIEAMGFGESLAGEFQAVPPDQDKSPFSARSYITSISNASFQIQPGETVPVDVTVNVPADPGLDTRYAVIYVKGTPKTDTSVSQILAVIVPVIITPAGAQMNKTGKITDLKVDPVESGKPIVVTTTLANTGNRHFKVKGDAKIINPDGQLVSNISIPVTGTSVVPAFSRELPVTYSALEKAGGLAPGTYSVEVQITMDDGTPVDSKTVSFEITKAYRPFPEINDEDLEIKCFNDEEPGVVDAREKTGVMVTFEGTGKVTGCVVIGSFTGVPEGTPRYEDSEDSGGMGGRAVKYYGVQVQGFKDGLAHIGVTYKPNELNGVNANDLFLAFRSGASPWKKLYQQVVQTGAGIVIGDVPVGILTDGPVQSMGAMEGGGLIPVTGMFANPVVLAGFGAVVLLIALAVFVMWQLKARKQPK